MSTARPCGVVTRTPVKLKHGLPAVGRQTPVGVPVEPSIGNGAPSAVVTATGHEPPHVEFVTVSKQVSLFVEPTTWMNTFVPEAPIGKVTRNGLSATPPRATLNGWVEQGRCVARLKQSSLFSVPVPVPCTSLKEYQLVPTCTGSETPAVEAIGASPTPDRAVKPQNNCAPVADAGFVVSMHATPAVESDVRTAKTKRCPVVLSK